METGPDITNKSRTRLKKEALELKELGKKLIDLSPDKLNRMELEQELKDEICFARTLKKHGALRRQIHFVASLLRKTDTEPILRALDDAMHDKTKYTRIHRQVEKFRDDLLAGDVELMLSLSDQFPDMDSGKLKKLVSQAIEDNLRGDAKKSSRELFRYLKLMVDSKN